MPKYRALVLEALLPDLHDDVPALVAAFNSTAGRGQSRISFVSHPSNGYYYTGPNVRASFERPYTQYGQVHEVALSLGSGEYLPWEFPLAFWMEQQGYDITYCSNVDAHLDAEVLNRCKVFLSVAHDEYWTRPMYDHVMAARNRGASLAFLSGNATRRRRRGWAAPSVSTSACRRSRPTFSGALRDSPGWRRAISPRAANSPALSARSRKSATTLAAAQLQCVRSRVRTAGSG